MSRERDDARRRDGGRERPVRFPASSTKKTKSRRLSSAFASALDWPLFSRVSLARLRTAALPSAVPRTDRRIRRRIRARRRFVSCHVAVPLRNVEGHAGPPHSGARARSCPAMSKSKRSRGTTKRHRDADTALDSLKTPDAGVRTRSGAVVAPPETSHGRVSGRAPSPAPGGSHPSPPATVETDEKRTRSPSSPGPAAEATAAASPPERHATPSSCDTTKRVDRRPDRGQDSRSRETDAPASPTHQTLARDAPAFDGSAKTRTVRFSRHVHGTPRHARRHARRGRRNRGKTRETALDTRFHADAPENVFAKKKISPPRHRLGAQGSGSRRRSAACS